MILTNVIWKLSPTLCERASVHWTEGGLMPQLVSLTCDWRGMTLLQPVQGFPDARQFVWCCAGISAEMHGLVNTALYWFSNCNSYCTDLIMRTQAWVSSDELTCLESSWQLSHAPLPPSAIWTSHPESVQLPPLLVAIYFINTLSTLFQPLSISCCSASAWRHMFLRWRDACYMAFGICHTSSSMRSEWRMHLGVTVIIRY